MISDVDFTQSDEPVDPEEIYRAATLAFRCSTCGRLHVFWNGMGQDPTVYLRE